MLGRETFAIGSAVLLGASLCVAGCGDAGEYYDMDQSEVASRLATASLPGNIGNRVTESGDLSARTYKRGRSQVVWELTAAGQPFGKFTADLEPDGDGTRVMVEFDLADNRLGEAARQDLADGAEFVQEALRVGMTEHVDAMLKGRSFDDREFVKDLAAYAVTHPGAAKNYLERMKHLQDSGEDLAVKNALEKQLHDDADWYGDVPVADARGDDPTPRRNSNW